MRLGFCLLLLAALPSAGCTRDRTQVMLGLMTNLYAPGELSKVRLSITRAGVPINDRVWNIPGTLRGDYQLPGSVGLYSEDGGAIEVAASLSAFSPGSDSVPIIQRDARFTLVPGQTLFTRLALSLNCLGPNARPAPCADGLTCVDGVCRQVVQDARRFPTYVAGLEGGVQCRTGVEGRDYHPTETAAPGLPPERQPKLPLIGGGQCQSGEVCIEGTCYKGGLEGEMPILGSDMAKPSDERDLGSPDLGNEITPFDMTSGNDTPEGGIPQLSDMRVISIDDGGLLSVDGSLLVRAAKQQGPVAR